MANPKEGDQPQTGMEAALAFSRKLPQIGVPPEIILQAGRIQSQTSSGEQAPATAWEQTRARIMQKEPNR